MCFFEVNVLSEVEKFRFWESLSINCQFKIHNIHRLHNIINPPTTILIIGTCKDSLFDTEGHFITHSTNESIRDGDSIIRVFVELWINGLSSPFIFICCFKELFEYLIKGFISKSDELLEIIGFK